METLPMPRSEGPKASDLPSPTAPGIARSLVASWRRSCAASMLVPRPPLDVQYRSDLWGKDQSPVSGSPCWAEPLLLQPAAFADGEPVELMPTPSSIMLQYWQGVM
eukprot:EG_transcript_32000